MRGLKKMDTAILPGYQLYHNYLREYEGLQRKTPAEVAGIRIVGENKWITVIQNAVKEPSRASLIINTGNSLKSLRLVQKIRQTISSMYGRQNSRLFQYEYRRWLRASK